MNYNLNLKIENELKQRNLTFLKATVSDLDEILELYNERIKWFTENEIEQWSGYFDYHPKNEFKTIIKDNNYFILKYNNKIIAGFELSKQDIYWKDNFSNVYYIYKLVTKVNCKGIGKLIIEICKDIAKNNNINVLRIDCLSDNKKLNDIYENYGFKLNGIGHIEDYSYSLRECNIDEL